MTDAEDTLALARAKWVPTDDAVKRIVAVAPPTPDNPVRLALIWLESEGRGGGVRFRDGPGAPSSWERGRAARDNIQLPDAREWNLGDIIFRLLEWRHTEGWPVPVDLILALATAENADLPGLAVRRLGASEKTDGSVAEGPGKARGPRKEFWPEVMGRAAARLTAYRGDALPAQAKVEQWLTELIEAGGQSAAESTVRLYARGLLDGYRDELGN
jgi:hypothetical protein